MNTVKQNDGCDGLKQHCIEIIISSVDLKATGVFIYKANTL